MWIYTHHGSIVCIDGVCEIRLQLNGANSEIHVVGAVRSIAIGAGTEEAVKEMFQRIKDAIEAPPEGRPTHLDFSH